MPRYERSATNKIFRDAWQAKLEVVGSRLGELLDIIPQR